MNLTYITPPAGVVLILAENIKKVMTDESLAGRGESEGTMAPMWRAIWLNAQVYETSEPDTQTRNAAVSNMTSELTMLLTLFDRTEDLLLINAARKLYYALTGKVRVDLDAVL